MHQKRQTLSFVKSYLSQVFFIVFTYKMTTKQLNIKHRSYCFYNDLINVLNFEASNLKLDKKHSKVLIFIMLPIMIKNLIGILIA